MPVPAGYFDLILIPRQRRLVCCLVQQWPTKLMILGMWPGEVVFLNSVQSITSPWFLWADSISGDASQELSTI